MAELLPVRPLGKQGMMASMQGYGCMGLTVSRGRPVSDEHGVAVLQRAFDLGVTHFDTAEVYRTEVDGVTLYNEELVGKFAAKVGRKNLTIATKYMPMGSKARASCEAASVRQSVEASLERLGTDYIDLYYLHRVPGKEGILENWMTAAKVLAEEGKIKYLGLSEATPDEIRRAHAIHPLTAIQQEWSLMFRSLEQGVVPTCRELGIGIVAYSPLARGVATAKVKKAEDWSKIGNDGGAASFRRSAPYLEGENLEKNAALLAPLEELAEMHQVSPAQLSLAWVQAQGMDVFPIPGTTKFENLESNISAAALSLKMGNEVFDKLGAAVDASKIVGNRYADDLMGTTIEAKLAKAKSPTGKGPLRSSL